MIEQGILNEIASLLKGSLVRQLEIPRRSTTYGSPGKPGLPKPVSGRYPTPISPPIASGNLIRNIDVKFADGHLMRAAVCSSCADAPDYTLLMQNITCPGSDACSEEIKEECDEVEFDNEGTLQ